MASWHEDMAAWQTLLSLHMKTKVVQHVPRINIKHLTYDIWHHDIMTWRHEDMTAWQTITFEPTHENKSCSGVNRGQKLSLGSTLSIWHMTSWHHDIMTSWHHDIMTLWHHDIMTWQHDKQSLLSLHMKTHATCYTLHAKRYMLPATRSPLHAPCYTLHTSRAVSYTHLRAHETSLHLVCRLLLEKKTPSFAKKLILSLRLVFWVSCNPFAE